MNNLELLEKYLNESLNEKEQIAFDRLMQEDAEFNEEVRLAVVLNANHKVQQKLHYQNLIKEQQSSTATPATKIFTLRNLRSIAAVMLIGLTVAMGWLMFGKSELNNMTLAGLTQKYPSPTITMGEDNLNANWKNAVKAYGDDNYSTTIVALERSLEAEENYKMDEKHFYLGLSHLYQKNPNYRKAIKHFEESKKLNATRYEQEANWFISLANIELGEKATAKALLQKIVDANGWKSTEAALMLKEF